MCGGPKSSWSQNDFKTPQPPSSPSISAQFSTHQLEQLTIHIYQLEPVQLSMMQPTPSLEHDDVLLGQIGGDARARIREKSASSQAKISSWAPPTPSSAVVQGNLRKAWCGYKLVPIWVRIREKSATSRWMDQCLFWHFFVCWSAFFLLINLHFLAPGPVHRLHIFCT